MVLQPFQGGFGGIWEALLLLPWISQARRTSEWSLGTSCRLWCRIFGSFLVLGGSEVSRRSSFCFCFLPAGVAN